MKISVTKEKAPANEIALFHVTEIKGKSSNINASQSKKGKDSWQQDQQSLGNTPSTISAKIFKQTSPCSRCRLHHQSVCRVKDAECIFCKKSYTVQVYHSKSTYLKCSSHNKESHHLAAHQQHTGAVSTPKALWQGICINCSVCSPTHQRSLMKDADQLWLRGIIL